MITVNRSVITLSKSVITINKLVMTVLGSVLKLMLEKKFPQAEYKTSVLFATISIVKDSSSTS